MLQIYHFVQLRKCCSVVFGVTLRLLVINISSSFPAINKLGGTMLMTPGGRSIDSARWSQILAQNRNFCLPHLHSTTQLGGGAGFVGILSRRLVQKTRMLRLPDGEKNFEDMITGFNIIHERDRRTDRRTDTAWRQAALAQHCVAKPHVIWRHYYS